VWRPFRLHNECSSGSRGQGEAGFGLLQADFAVEDAQDFLQ
jgi:hypothetical protein